MLRAISTLGALFLAAAILYSGNGLQFTLISVRADIEDFSTLLIGLMMSAYYAGFIVGCRITPDFIKSVGHIRTFVALASVASASALAHSLVVDIFVWSALRGISGFCFAGMAMVLESWINARANNANRGRILSIYRIVDLSALTAGNAMLALADPAGFKLFALISILVSLALVPIALTKSTAPAVPAAARLRIRMLIAASPVGAAGALMVGLANASFWSVGPIYVQRVGYDADTVAVFMMAVIIGAALAQWPLGWISDKIDRRHVIAASGIACAAAAFSLAEFGGDSKFHLVTAGAFLGAFMIPMFGLSVAHANDISSPEQAVETNGGLLLLHGCGSVIGAILGGVIISAAGPKSLFVYIGVVYIILAVFCLFRTMKRANLRRQDKTKFLPLTRGAAPTIFEIAQDDEETPAC